jgi:hypothetical protein
LSTPVGIADVVPRMQDISAHLPVADGVRAFNDVYLKTTRPVSAALTAQAFVDGECIDRLDVRFAELYFGILEEHVSDLCTAPRCWRVAVALHRPTGLELGGAVVGAAG